MKISRAERGGDGSREVAGRGRGKGRGDGKEKGRSRRRGESRKRKGGPSMEMNNM